MRKRPPNRFSSDKNHRSYGIKNWLIKVNIATNKNGNGIDGVLYEKLLTNFCAAYGWKPMKKKILSEIEQKELFENQNFDTFNSYYFKYGKVATMFKIKLLVNGDICYI